MKTEGYHQLLACLLTMTLSCFVCPTSGQEIATAYRVKKDEPHPDFLYPQITDREAISLSQFRGKKVLLLHFASW